jgi:DUF971 family protein
MSVQPTKLALTPDNRLAITWSDGLEQSIAIGQLRKSCPCASCREKRNAPPPSSLELTILKPEEAQPLKLMAMEPVGHYAYSIHFSDGHDTGIFTFDLLRELGQPQPPSAS